MVVPRVQLWSNTLPAACQISDARLDFVCWFLHVAISPARSYLNCTFMLGRHLWSQSNIVPTCPSRCSGMVFHAKKTTVTAYLKSKQLLLLAFVFLFTKVQSQTAVTAYFLINSYRWLPLHFSGPLQREPLTAGSTQWCMFGLTSKRMAHLQISSVRKRRWL